MRADPATSIPPRSPRDRVRAAIRRALQRRPLARIHQRYAHRRPDLEIRQLSALRNAYSTSSGPDVLLFGDSAMFWTRAGETDTRTLGEMLRDALGRETSLHTVVGPGYNARLVMAFLSALDERPSRPKVVVVPTSVMMASRAWLRHPALAYQVESEALRGIVASGQPYPTRLPRATTQHWDEYDRMPADSLSDAKRTYGEIRMIVNAIPAPPVGLPTTKWQHLVRVRQLLDLANAERLGPDTEGVRLVSDLASMLKAVLVPSIAYIAPVNVEVIAKFWGPAAVEHVVANAAVIEAAYRGAGGESADVVNAAAATPASEFSDSAHLTETGRMRLANEMAEALRRHLDH